MKLALWLVGIFFAGALLFISCKRKPPEVGPGSVSSAGGVVSFDWDRGPNQIDDAVKAYPSDMQATYNNVFKMKCSQCHPLARAIWAPYDDEALWKKIVTKMANRPGSAVTAEEADKILKFVVFDHNKRKSAIDKAFQDNHWQKKDPAALQ